MTDAGPRPFRDRAAPPATRGCVTAAWTLLALVLAVAAWIARRLRR